MFINILYMMFALGLYPKGNEGQIWVDTMFNQPIFDPTFTFIICQYCVFDLILEYTLLANIK